MSLLVKKLGMAAAGAGGGPAPGGYFLISKDGGSDPWGDCDRLRGIDVDSSNNVYILFGISANSSSQGALVKTDLDGVIQWKKKVELSTSGGYWVSGLRVDSSDRPHVFGTYPPNTEDTLFLSCINPSTGAVSFSQSYGDPSYSDRQGMRPFTAGFQNLEIDDNDKLYFSAGSTCTYQDNRVVSFIVSAGSSSYTTDQFTRVSGNVSEAQGTVESYACGTNGNGDLISYCKAGSSIALVRHNDGGTQQSSYAPASGGLPYIHTDGNFYYTRTSDETSITVLKYNSSGTKQFETKLTRNSSYATRTQQIGSIAVDYDGNVYVAFTTEVSSKWRPTVAKLNSSGTLQWVNNMTWSQNSDMRSQAIRTDSTGSYYIGMGQNIGQMAKLPGTGDLTGSWTVGSYTFGINTNATVTASSTSDYENWGSGAISVAGSLTDHRGGGTASYGTIGDPTRVVLS